MLRYPAWLILQSCDPQMGPKLDASVSCVADFAAVLLKELGPAPFSILLLSRRQSLGRTQALAFWVSPPVQRAWLHWDQVLPWELAPIALGLDPAFSVLR